MRQIPTALMALLLYYLHRKMIAALERSEPSLSPHWEQAL